MSLNPSEIQDVISQITFVKVIKNFSKGDFYITGSVEISLPKLSAPITFDIQIAPQYPFKTFDTESIKFINPSLIIYNHVMGDGAICIHTSHSKDLHEKLKIDVQSLKNWIEKYIINGDSDIHYEHLILKESPINDNYYSYTFSDLDGRFQKGEFGKVKLSPLSSGLYRENFINNFIVQSFISSTGLELHCQWNDRYKKLPLSPVEGIFYFTEESPSLNKRFCIANWMDLNQFVQSDFNNYLNDQWTNCSQNNENIILPLFLGFRIPGQNIHWVSALITKNSYPLREIMNKNERGIIIPKLSFQDIIIDWGVTRNASYSNFFGRGKFSNLITNKKILIIGVGAIGSMIAKTLTRGGCKFLDFIDYDIKEPENVCRSEYFFQSGICNKTDELINILSGISPHITSKRLNNNYFENVTKGFQGDTKYTNKLTSELNNYDYIIDCSTDNDLMYILNSLEVNATLINLSITNHAKELVCAFHLNIYNFVLNQFSNILQNDVDDLYNPTGCWSPTFKASYNDINVLVQIALKRVNKLISERLPLNNFVVQEDENQFLKIIEY